ncbi:5' exonuclease Apollo [Morella rubra]|uniref:5' exonuclease Apollo n=1 Tax=Morella rubra TaxID=262757 RepID=A0A6A1VB82_9ROSI|nr:5' exonuclease Apollo [Morella rubra]
MDTKKNPWLMLSLIFLGLSVNNHLSLGADTISANQSLPSDQTIVSAGGNFVLGFFSPVLIIQLIHGWLQVVNIIASHPEHDIIIGIDTLGKEDLLLRIHALKIKIWLWPERLQTMHLLGFHDIFTTKTSLTRVRAVPRYSFSTETLEFLNATRPTIGIMPSGLPWSGGSGSHTDKQNGDLQYVEKLNEYSYSVPYSDHSCFAELQDFIKLVQPTNIKGIVSSSTCYINPLYYFGRLCRANQPAQRLHWKHKRKGKGERAPTVWTRATFSEGAC